MDRRDKINYYLDIAEQVLSRGTCLRRNYGSIIVKNDEIISTGYTGAPRGRENCIDLGFCYRKEFNIPSGQRYEACRSVHAEMNSIISAGRKDMLGATLYLVGIEADNSSYVKNAEPCTLCKRLIINSGIEKVISRIDKDNYKETLVDEWITNDDSLSGFDKAQKEKQEQKC